MLKIDIHTHIVPQHLPSFMDQFGYGGFIQLKHMDHSQRHCPCAHMIKDDGTFFREIFPNTWDPMIRLHECDSHSIHVQVLSIIPVMFYYWAKPEHTLYVSQFLNDHLSQLVHQFPKRFIGLGTVPLQDPDLACRELHRLMKDLKLNGVQIGSHIGAHNLDDPMFYPFYEEAEKLNAAIFVHPWDMMGMDTMKKYWLPWLVSMPAETTRAICSMIFGGIFEKFPRLKVAFAHGGGSFPGTIGRIRHGYHVRPDLCAIDNPHDPQKYLGKFFVDSLVHDPQQLNHLINLFGVDKVALGSDYPFPLGEHSPGEMIEQSQTLTHKQKSYLLHQSALDWLGLPKEKFL